MKYSDIINESVPNSLPDYGSVDTSIYPKVTFKEVPYSHRKGDHVSGKVVMGAFTLGKERTLVNVNDYDYQWAKSEGLKLKPEEILVRVENQATKQSGNSVENASIAKLNLKSSTVSFLKDYDAEDLEWESQTKVSKVVIHLPFTKTI